MEAEIKSSQKNKMINIFQDLSASELDRYIGEIVDSLDKEEKLSDVDGKEIKRSYKALSKLLRNNKTAKFSFITDGRESFFDKVAELSHKKSFMLGLSVGAGVMGFLFSSNGSGMIDFAMKSSLGTVSATTAVIPFWQQE